MGWGFRVSRNLLNWASPIFEGFFLKCELLEGAVPCVFEHLHLQGNISSDLRALAEVYTYKLACRCFKVLEFQSDPGLQLQCISSCS